MKKHNIIPRRFNKIIARRIETGDLWELTPNKYGGNLHGINKAYNSSWYVFKVHVRIPAEWEILEII